MQVFYAFLMGLLQGLTEFLPVSSSGHLVLFTRVTGISSSLFFDLFLHLGSLTAVLIAERKTVAELVKQPFCRKARCLYVASAATFGVVLLLKGVTEQAFDGQYLAVSFFVTAILLFVSNRFLPERNEPLSTTKAVIIGVFQGFAVFPGVSRSGTTFTAGKVLGLEREENLSFCFLLSVPVIAGGALLSLLTEQAEAVAVLPLVIGFFAALASALFALKLIKRAFSRRAFDLFSVYLTALSLFLTLNDLVLGLF